MTVDSRRELEDKAHSLAMDGSFSEAADNYVRAGFEEAGQFFGLSSRGIELRMFFKACLCYRLAEQERQCRFVADFAIDLAKEYATRVEEKTPDSQFPNNPEQGVWYDFIGDFEQVAGFGDGTKAYNRAKKVYSETGDPFASFGEGPIRSVQAIFDDLVFHTNSDPDLVAESTQGRLTDWIEYKQERLPKLVQDLMTSKKWHGQ
ncbi:hypothetical protein [Halorussus ruber]|uniref:hypothetical protein n=1 Tax=Halorussus ruber TaxID=1126238 RepID=UPI001093101D|nr:hypothetical protein [Halorussus ruber]